MSIHHRGHVTGATLSLLLAGAVMACGGTHPQAKAPQSAAASTPAASTGQPAPQSAGAQTSGASGAGGGPHGSAAAPGFERAGRRRRRRARRESRRRGAMPEAAARAPARRRVRPGHGMARGPRVSRGVHGAGGAHGRADHWRVRRRRASARGAGSAWFARCRPHARHRDASIARCCGVSGGRRLFQACRDHCRAGVTLKNEFHRERHVAFAKLQRRQRKKRAPRR